MVIGVLLFRHNLGMSGSLNTVVIGCADAQILSGAGSRGASALFPARGPFFLRALSGLVWAQIGGFCFAGPVSRRGAPGGAVAGGGNAFVQSGVLTTIRPGTKLSTYADRPKRYKK